MRYAAMTALDVPPPSIHQVAETAATRDCATLAVSIVADKEKQTVARLLVRNVGQDSCSLRVSPDIQFDSRSGKPLRVRAFNMFMRGNLGHGPVMRRITIPPGSTATADLSWDDDRPLHRRCVTTFSARVSTRLSQSVYRSAVTLRICGHAGLPIEFHQNDLKLD